MPFVRRGSTDTSLVQSVRDGEMRQFAVLVDWYRNLGYASILSRAVVCWRCASRPILFFRSGVCFIRATRSAVWVERPRLPPVRWLLQTIPALQPAVKAGRTVR